MTGCPPPSTPDAALPELLAWLSTAHPEIRVLPKSGSRLCKAIDRALRVVTFGRQNRFMTDFTTTLGARIYVPDGWGRTPAVERYCVLRHELVHVAQFRRWTLPGMAICYLLFPVPFLFAAARAGWELEAYRESLRAMHAVGLLRPERSAQIVAWMVERFTGPDYAWMWVAGGMIREALTRTVSELHGAADGR